MTRKDQADHPNVPSVDQDDRRVPINLRQSDPTAVEMLISTRVRKSAFWHLSMEAGAWRATIYNRCYHPRGYRKPEDGGTMAEYDALVNRVTMWNVGVERQIRVQGPDAEAFSNYVITRDAAKIAPMAAKYCILCNEAGCRPFYTNCRYFGRTQIYSTNCGNCLPQGKLGAHSERSCLEPRVKKSYHASPDDDTSSITSFLAKFPKN